MSEKEKSKIYSFDRYTLYSSVNGNGRKARFVFSIRDGMPRVTVFTNDPNDKDPKQNISIPLDPVNMISLLDQLTKVAISKDENEFVYHSFVPVRAEDGKMIDRTLVGQIVIGKDSQGMVYISAIAENRPKIKFVFGQGSTMVQIKKPDGTPLSDADFSALTALSTAKSLSFIYMIQAEKNMVEYAMRPKGATAPANNYTAKKTSESSTDNFEDVPY